jgi:amino acid transporter
MSNVNSNNPPAERVRVVGSVPDNQQGITREKNRLNLSTVDLFALGLSIVLSGQYNSWNYGLVGGFGNFIIAAVVVTTAYVCLVLCIAELSSALPFAGIFALIYFQFQ